MGSVRKGAQSRSMMPFLSALHSGKHYGQIRCLRGHPIGAMGCPDFKRVGLFRTNFDYFDRTVSTSCRNPGACVFIGASNLFRGRFILW